MVRETSVECVLNCGCERCRFALCDSAGGMVAAGSKVGDMVDGDGEGRAMVMLGAEGKVGCGVVVRKAAVVGRNVVDG